MQEKLIAAWLVVLTTTLAACSTSAPNPKSEGSKTESAAALPKLKPLDPNNFDTKADPCADIFQFTNGNWIARHPIPAERSSWSAAAEIEERNLELLHRLLEEAAQARAPQGSIQQKVGDYYYTAMNEAQIEAAGVKPLADEFARIAALKDAAELSELIGSLHRYGVGVGFTFYVDQDAKQSDQYMAQIYQGGLGLPNRDYYFDDKYKEIRQQYLEHVTKMFTLLGDEASTAKAEANTVMALETRLAKVSMRPEEQRDPNAIYHKTMLAELMKQAPDFAWERYCKALELSNPSVFNVAQPKFIKELNAMMKTVPLADWKTYLRWQVITDAASSLSKAFDDEDFRFYSTVLNGVKEQKPRWKRSVEWTDSALGEALGQLYVAQAFTPAAKARVQALVENLKAAFRERIQALDWMGEATKQQALKKLETLNFKIGYPDKWRDYSSLPITRDSFFENVKQATLFEFRRNLKKLGQPIDRDEWVMTPPTVNAYYNPTKNEMVFPAGILQPPFFDVEADDAVNYGETGATIGHEMVHAFDDEGRQFDEQGNLKNWWTPEDEKKFKERAAGLEKQFNDYVVIDDLHINGKLTMGENIADLGGLIAAYSAFQKAQQGKPPQPKIDGFTPEQRFFMAYAESWRANSRPERLRLMLSDNPHAPERFRAIGPVSNLPEFFQAFGCKDEKLMNRVKIW